MNTPFPYALDPAANKQPYIYGVSCTVYSLAVVAVVLRLVSRRLSKAGFRADDFLIIASLLIDTVLFIDMMLLLRHGLGRHLKSLVQYSSFMKIYILGDVMFTCTLALTKYSILLFYWRIFGHAKSIQWPIYILLGLTTAWLVEVVFISIFECSPIAFSWDLSIKGGHCVNLFHFFLATLLINFVTDLAILSLPMHLIWRLQQSTTHKVLISGMFLLGSFVCFISIIRLTILTRTDFSSIDETWNGADFTMWCNVEASIAIVSGCLPSLRPILTAAKSGLYSLYKHSQSSSLKNSGNASIPRGQQHDISNRDRAPRQKYREVEDDMIPMHSLQAQGGHRIKSQEGSTRMESEVFTGFEAQEQLESRRDKLERGKL